MTLMNSSQLRNVNVLIVDDEKMIQRLVYDVLRKLGFAAITIASSGRQAIEHVKKQSFDFVISDWRMKDMDGIDLVNFVRKSPESTCPRIPIIMLTGNTEAYYVLRARDAGANEYLLKPFSAEQLVRRIRAIIEHPKRFIETPTYRGPERRNRDKGPPVGQAERRKSRKKV